MIVAHLALGVSGDDLAHSKRIIVIAEAEELVHPFTPAVGKLSALRSAAGYQHTVRTEQAANALCQALFGPVGTRSEAHTCTPGTNAHIVCRLLLAHNKQYAHVRD